MKANNRQKGALFLLTFGMFIVVGTLAVMAIAAESVNRDSSGVAIKGYDTVAYHTEGRAIRGSNEFSHTWNDAVWYFASEKNRNLFAADPERYAPQYGGF